MANKTTSKKNIQKLEAYLNGKFNSNQQPNQATTPKEQVGRDVLLRNSTRPDGQKRH